MEITKNVLENCKSAIKYFEANPNSDKFIGLRNGDEKYIDFLIEKGNWYYGNDNLVYWDGSVFGFTFRMNLFEEDKDIN
jgi:hypothetical protein